MSYSRRVFHHWSLRVAVSYRQQGYKNKGLNGWGDFLGTENIRPGSKWQREEDPET